MLYLSCLSTTHSALTFNSTPEPNTTQRCSVLLYSATKQKIEWLRASKRKAEPFHSHNMELSHSILSKPPKLTSPYLSDGVEISSMLVASSVGVTSVQPRGFSAGRI
jgi:hypothetical protein